MRKASGFTLIEALIGLALSLIVVTAGLEFLIRAGKSFRRLKDREEAGQAAMAGLDRMRIDLLHAGRGLSAEIGMGLVEAAAASDDELRTTALEKGLALAAAAAAGATRLTLVSTSDLAAGQRIVISDVGGGEVRTVTAVEGQGVILDLPLAASYAPGGSALGLLEEVAYFLDGTAGILRRRVNGGPAQPLLENAAAAAWTLDPLTHLVRLRLELDVEGAHPHEATVFLKNAALAAVPR